MGGVAPRTCVGVVCYWNYIVDPTKSNQIYPYILRNILPKYSYLQIYPPYYLGGNKNALLYYPIPKRIKRKYSPPIYYMRHLSLLVPIIPLLPILKPSLFFFLQFLLSSSDKPGLNPLFNCSLPKPHQS